MLDLGRYDEAAVLLARLVSAEPGEWPCLVPVRPGAPGRGPVRRGGRGRQQGRRHRARRGVAAPARPSNALMHLGNHAEALRAAAESRRLAPALLADARLRRAGRAGGLLSPPSPPPRPPRRAGWRLNEPDVHFLSARWALARGGPGRRARTPGARARARPGAQRRHERARPDPAAPPRHGWRDQALHQRGADHAGRAHLQQEHRRGYRQVGVADDLHLRADRDAAAVGTRGDAHRRAPGRRRVRRARPRHRGVLRWS